MVVAIPATAGSGPIQTIHKTKAPQKRLPIMQANVRKTAHAPPGRPPMEGRRRTSDEHLFD